jgi:hypothetical protein
VTQKRNRVVVTATLSPALLAKLAEGEEFFAGFCS